jgi:GAF domain-containing protein
VSELTNLRLLDLLAATAQELVDRLKADASTVSRAIGDVLILVTERAPEGRTLLMGQGYLVPDYPLTQAVLESGRPRTLTLDDDDVDPAEASVLEELGFASLLMLPLSIGGSTWGLVEVYRLEPIPFGTDDVRIAGEIVARTSARAG